MGAPKYSQIRRRVQADQRDKQARLNRHSIKDDRRYPYCNGMFDTCPSQEDFQKAIETDKSQPPTQCKRCIIFKESEFYKQELDHERIELWKKMMGREKQVQMNKTPHYQLLE